MGVSIGVVCEGSHDFVVLKSFVSKICEDNAITLDDFDALQPEVSATFAQVGRGGWGAVKGWCETRNGTFYRTFIDAPLFANSRTYDLLLIHVDGDVLDICETGSLAGISSSNRDCADIVAQLETAVLQSWLNVRQEDSKKVVVCVPVRHLEAWLLAGLTDLGIDLETTGTKDLFRLNLEPVYPGKNLSLYQSAAADAVKNLDNIRSRCVSYFSFESKLNSTLST